MPSTVLQNLHRFQAGLDSRKPLSGEPFGLASPQERPLESAKTLFLDGEVRLVKNLTDLNHVAFVGGAPLRPFHELFF
jgi:hypothetical protein